MYLARRLIRMAVEDIGLADHNASPSAIPPRRLPMLGTTAGELALAEAVVYLATAPKSNALYRRSVGQANGQGRRLLLPPKQSHAPTKLIVGRLRLGYQYDHACGGFSAGLFSGKPAAPDFYQPTERGYENGLGRMAEGSAAAGTGGSERGLAALIAVQRVVQQCKMARSKTYRLFAPT